MKSSKAARRSPALDWICDLSGKTARITSMGNRSLLVENHCGVREFAKERIVVATHCGCLEVDGDSLSLSEVRPGALVICGSLRHVKLPCMEADDEP